MILVIEPRIAQRSVLRIQGELQQVLESFQFVRARLVSVLFSFADRLRADVEEFCQRRLRQVFSFPCASYLLSQTHFSIPPLFF